MKRRSALHALVAGALLARVLPGAAQRAVDPLAAADYAALRLLQPAHEQTVHDNTGRVEVAVALEPALDVPAGHRLRVRVDGALLPNAWTDARFELEGIHRGAHTLQAVVTDHRGNTLAASEEITFYMWQASRQFPSR